MARAAKFFGVLALLALNAEGAINLVTHKIAKDLTGAEITALATNSYNSTAGNLIVVWTVTYSGAQPIGIVSDSADDTFTPLTVNRGTWIGQFFYAKSVKGSSDNVVTIRPAGTGRATFIYPGMIVMEFSGADKTAPLDLEVKGTNGSLSGAWTSDAFNAAAGELVLLGIATANGGAFVPAAGFRIADSYLTPSSSKFSFAALNQVFPSPQTNVIASVTWTGTLQATGAALTFKPAGGK